MVGEFESDLPSARCQYVERMSEQQRETWQAPDATFDVWVRDHKAVVVGAEGTPTRGALLDAARDSGAAHLQVAFVPGDALSVVVADEDELVATNMAVDVADVPAPEHLHLRPMGRDRFEQFVEYSMENYAQSLLDSGSVRSRATALEIARKQFDQLLPDGHLTEAAHLLVVSDDGGDEVGILWLAERDDEMFVYDVEMLRSARGKGYGTQTLRHAARIARELGHDTLALNVFGHNDGARRLYLREGYRITREVRALAL